MNYGRLYEHYPYAVSGTSRQVATWAAYLLTFWEDGEASGFAVTTEGACRLWTTPVSLQRLMAAGEQLDVPSPERVT